jgi:hypothetical protein
LNGLRRIDEGLAVSTRAAIITFTIGLVSALSRAQVPQSAPQTARFEVASVNNEAYYADKHANAL